MADVASRGHGGGMGTLQMVSLAFDGVQCAPGEFQRAAKRFSDLRYDESGIVLDFAAVPSASFFAGRRPLRPASTSSTRAHMFVNHELPRIQTRAALLPEDLAAHDHPDLPGHRRRGMASPRDSRAPHSDCLSQHPAPVILGIVRYHLMLSRHMTALTFSISCPRVP